jgi:quinol monooxygenase YgiN
MYYLIVCEKKSLFYETFDDKPSLDEHINSRKRYFLKKFKNNQAYIVKGEEIFTAKKHLDEEIDLSGK